jgi:hypothetical protein
MMWKPVRTYHLLVVFVLLAVINVPAGAQEAMVHSNRDLQLPINAWGGAQHGTELKLHNGCQLDNPDCTWTIR